MRMPAGAPAADPHSCAPPSTTPIVEVLRADFLATVCPVCQTFDAHRHEAVAVERNAMQLERAVVGEPSGVPIRDREYVLFAKVPDEDRYIPIAGSDPTVNEPAAPPFNLPRQLRPASG
jgi:hypothetical protein